jgi:hypothetical protein
LAIFIFTAPNTKKITRQHCGHCIIYVGLQLWEGVAQKFDQGGATGDCLLFQRFLSNDIFSVPGPKIIQRDQAFPRFPQDGKHSLRAWHMRGIQCCEMPSNERVWDEMLDREVGWTTELFGSDCSRRHQHLKSAPQRIARRLHDVQKHNAGMSFVRFFYPFADLLLLERPLFKCWATIAYYAPRKFWAPHNMPA